MAQEEANPVPLVGVMASWRYASSGLLREVPRHHEPHEHREDDPADHGRKQLRARQPGQIKQRVQHAANSRSGTIQPQGGVNHSTRLVRPGAAE